MTASSPNSMVSDPSTHDRHGWHLDELGRFEQRYYLAGEPTYLVRNGTVESFDEPVPVAHPALEVAARTVTIQVVPIGTYARQRAPIEIAATALKARERAADPTKQPSQSDLGVVPSRLSTYPAEYAPPPNSLSAYQPPIYPSQAYTAQFVFAQLLSDVENGTPTEPPAFTVDTATPPVAPTGPEAASSTVNNTAPPASAAPLWKRKRVRIGLVITTAVLVIASTVATAISIITTSGGRSAPAGESTGIDGTLFTSQVGHFRAQFPSPPTDVNAPASGTGSIQFNLQGAWCTNPITEIAAETTATPVPKDEQDTAMQLALTSFSTSAKQTDQGQSPTTYSGHPGRMATLTMTNGTQLTALVYFYSDTRLYILVAPIGIAFSELLASFVPLP